METKLKLTVVSLSNGIAFKDKYVAKTNNEMNILNQISYTEKPNVLPGPMKFYLQVKYLEWKKTKVTLCSDNGNWRCMCKSSWKFFKLKWKQYFSWQLILNYIIEAFN